MKHQHKSIVIALFITILSACAPAIQQQEPVTNPTQSPESGVIDTNALFLDYLNNNQELIKTNILITCKTAYPELAIEDAIPGPAINYAVDQNPTTVSYSPTVQINLGNIYYVDISSGVFTTRNSDKVVIANENITNLVTTEALKTTGGRTNFTANVALEAISGSVYVKTATCTLD